MISKLKEMTPTALLSFTVTSGIIKAGCTHYESVKHCSGYCF